MDKLLTIMEANARLSLEEMAAMLGEAPEAVAKRIDEYAKDGVIRGTRTLINWEKVGGNGVQALIDVRVSPKKGHGFDEIAEMISMLDEVDGVMLMSGGYDLSVSISGATFQDVAMFVSRRLSPLDDVLSTATHFVLRTYKKDGALYGFENKDERESATL
ncbi:Lrp/AsnC family transcriptional regulator [Ruminococcaceae bacterium OttesenSCG-928-A16]|nr:Lrp/AsnC family transcriptional regulator [Ruminococcaceae bacterium OttesenSCG-928-A16]